MSDQRLLSKPLSELSQYVTDDVNAIRKCLTWIEKVQDRYGTALEAVYCAIEAEYSSKPAGDVVRRQARRQLITFRDLLSDPAYKTVVKESVVANMSPLLSDLVETCNYFAGAIMIDLKHWQRDESIQTIAKQFPARWNAMQAELRALVRLLAFRLSLADADKPVRLAVNAPKGDSPLSAKDLATQAGKPKKATANALMLEVIQKDQDAMGWSSLEWSKKIKRAKSTIVETPTWENCKMVRDRKLAERARDRRHRSRHYGNDKD